MIEQLARAEKATRRRTRSAAVDFARNKGDDIVRDSREFAGIF